MATLITGIIIQGIAIIIVKNMDIFLRIVLGHTSKVTTKGGWAKPHVSTIWRLITSADIAQQGQRHQVMSSIKEKARWILKMLEMKWKRHGRERRISTHQVEKGSPHPMGQVITSHQNKQY